MNRNSCVTDTVKCGRIGLYYYYCAPETKIESVQLILPPKLKPTNILSPKTLPRKPREPNNFHLPPIVEPNKAKKNVKFKNIIQKNIDSIRLILPPKLEPVKTVTTRQIIRRNVDSLRRILSPKLERPKMVGLRYMSRKYVNSSHLILPKIKSSRIVNTRIIPYYKIVAGTRFAIDAFSYGEIPNVKYYFLTHFHSDHYTGLRRSFNKSLFCSKITDLCVSRLGVSPKCIHVIKTEEAFEVEGIEVTAVDANHCPGSLMLIFTLPNGKTLLHTGDFRATPAMESYPIFWNKDIHTVYLDTTYCNPRYDFPNQDQILEVALHLLGQKKLALEKAGKKFSSVLIICGAYTIGKEKLFLGIARRVGCSVWACPQKNITLRGVRGHRASRIPPQSCQLHVVPMEDLTHEKLRRYLDSFYGIFSEVVAFKPSGWESDSNSTIEKDMVTIHEILPMSVVVEVGRTERAMFKLLQTSLF